MTPAAAMRRRLVTVAVAFVLLVAVAVDGVLYASLRSQLLGDLHRNAVATAGLARAESAHLPPAALVERLDQLGLAAVVRGPDGSEYRTTKAPERLPAAGWVTSEVQLDSGRGRTMVGVSRAAVDAFLRRLLLIEAVVTLVAATLAAVLFRTVATSILRPLEKMLAVVRSQAAGHRGQRIRPEPDCLVGGLGRAYDDMIDGQEAAIAQTKAARDRSRSFLADAAHQIRTPIAGIQAGAETLLRRPPSARPDEEQVLSELLQETSRVGRLISDLLLAARLDQGVHLELAPCDLHSVCSQEAQRIRRLEPALEVTTLTLGWGEPWPWLDSKAIHDILANLLDHARRRATSEVSITLTKGDGTVEVSVADDGPDLAEDVADRVFEPFTSLDGHDRSGLGLPIARELARAHGGDLRYQDHSFVLSLPWGSDPAQVDDGTGRTHPPPFFSLTSGAMGEPR